MAGRKRNDLSGTGAQGDLARRLRVLRDESGLTFRQLAAKSGYSQATLSSAEAGRRPPSWEVTEAFVQSCGDDPRQWRQLWELATTRPATLPAEETTVLPAEEGDPGAPAPNPPAVGPEPLTSVSVVTARLKFRRVRLIVAAALILIAVIGVIIARLAANPAAPSTPAASLSMAAAAPRADSPSAMPSAPYPVRRHDTTMMRAGERISLDAPPTGPWPRATHGSAGYDLEFTLADRLLVSVGTETTGASLAVISAPTDSYADCSQTSDYSGVVPTSAIKPGTEFCVLTSQRRRALIVIRAVHHDKGNLPDQVTLTITSWQHIVPPGS